MDRPAFQVFQCTNADCRFRFPASASSEVAVQSCPRCGRSIERPAGPQTSRRLTYVANVPAGPPVAAILDNIRSAYNVGAMFRTADGAGLAHLYLCGMTATPEHARLAKTALGAETSVAWSYHPNGLDLAQELGRRGYQLWAIENEARAVSLFDPTILIPARPLALVVGNELAGIDPGILAICQRILALPMSGRKSSLNAEVAFGIAAYFVRFAARPEQSKRSPVLPDGFPGGA